MNKDINKYIGMLYLISIEAEHARIYYRYSRSAMWLSITAYKEIDHAHLMEYRYFAGKMKEWDI